MTDNTEAAHVVLRILESQALCFEIYAEWECMAPHPEFAVALREIAARQKVVVRQMRRKLRLMGQLRDRQRTPSADRSATIHNLHEPE